MRLEATCARWEQYWQRVSDASEIERQLAHLRWLEEFAFHPRSAVDVQNYQALQQQIGIGEKKLAELCGDAVLLLPKPEQPEWVNR